MGKLASSFRRIARIVSDGADDMREYEQIAGFSQIARRALANNSFDGVLTTIGVIMGNYVAGVRDVSIVIRTGVATSMAIGISGMWGAYLAESAERSCNRAAAGRALVGEVTVDRVCQIALTLTRQNCRTVQAIRRCMPSCTLPRCK